MKKKVNNCFAVLFTFAILAVGVSFVVHAGPCYNQTSTISASAKGCYEDFIGPAGQACPSMVFPNREGGNVPTGCGYKIQEHSFGIGTSGNDPTGRMSQGFISRPCYSYQGCTFSGPHWVPAGFPVADNLYYTCSADPLSPGLRTASSFEPIGAACPGE